MPGNLTQNTNHGDRKRLPIAQQDSANLHDDESSRTVTSAPGIRDGRLQLIEEVRTALVTQRTCELIDQLSQPNTKALVSEALKRDLGGLVTTLDTMASEHLGAKDRKSAESFINQTVDAIISKPEILAQYAARIAVLEWRSPHEPIMSYDQGLIDALVESGMKREAIAGEIDVIESPIRAIINRQQQLILRLAEIAEVEGVEAAISKEKMYAVIREMSPSAELYLDQHKKDIEAMRAFPNKIVDFLSRIEDFGEVAPAMKAGWSIQIAFRELVLEQNLKATIRSIYGVEFNV